MPQTNANRFHPKRWTALTWLAVLLWIWQAFPLNYPPSVSYTMDSVTGEFSVPTHYKILAEIPFPVGWPLHYVTPIYLTAPVAPAMPIGAPLPPPAPSSVSLFAMVGNFVLIGIAISALVYFLQKMRYQFSLFFLLALMSAIPFYFALGRLVALLAGHNAVRWYIIAVYFSPIAAAVAVRYSFFPRLKLPRFRLIWSVRPRSFDYYDNPDDAIADASRLDSCGDWNASIDLYRRAAERWPEHTEYIQQCINSVAAKQSLAQT